MSSSSSLLPTTDANISSAPLFAGSSFVESFFLVPGITMLEGSDAEVINPLLVTIFSEDWIRNGPITGSFNNICKISACVLSTKYLLCFKTNFTLPYDTVAALMKFIIDSATGTFDNRFKTSMISSVSNPTETAAYKEYAVIRYSWI